MFIFISLHFIIAVKPAQTLGSDLITHFQGPHHPPTMILVDVFWSFAMGAAFACAASEGIQRSKHIFINKYFIFTVCYLSMIFAPSGIYLLWNHTAWETMFFLDRSLHGIWPCVFAHTNVLLGVLGFCVCYRMIQAGMAGSAHAVWTTSYTCMFSILTFGYNRFLYAGNIPSFSSCHYVSQLLDICLQTFENIIRII